MSHLQNSSLAHLDPAAIDAVLFDMDGTLLDSHAVVTNAWIEVAQRNGLDVDEVLQSIPGVPAEWSLRRLLPDADEDFILAEHERLLERECTDLDGVVALPGALELIGFLHQHRTPWAVVTSALPRLASARLGAVGIEPPILVTPEDTERGKPFPDPFIEGARRVGLPIERCLVLEDSVGGLEAGRASGAVVVDVGPTGTTLTAVLARFQGENGPAAR